MSDEQPNHVKIGRGFDGLITALGKDCVDHGPGLPACQIALPVNLSTADR